MKKETEKYISIKINVALLEKFRQIAESEGRSLRGQLRYLIMDCVRRFERKQKKARFKQA